MCDLFPSTKCLSARPNSDVETWMQNSRILGRKILQNCSLLDFAGAFLDFAGFCWFLRDSNPPHPNPYAMLLIVVTTIIPMIVMEVLISMMSIVNIV